MNAAASRYNESLSNFFIEELCADADKVYRFGFALTLSPDGAKWCVDQTFRSMADTLEGVHAASKEMDPSVLAVKECWQAFRGAKGKSFKPGGSPLVKAFTQLTTDERAMVVAVDVIGLSLRESEFALGFDETDAVRLLGSGRKKLMDAGL